MFFPVLAIASLLVFLVIVLLLWLADTLENHRQPTKEELLMAEPFTFLSLPQAFEPMFAVLWEAPIHALELTHDCGTRGILVSRLRSTFDEAARRFPEVYDGYGFEQWLQFLEYAELIQWSGQRATLTSKGEGFLAYRFTTDALVPQWGHTPPE